MEISQLRKEYRSKQLSSKDLNKNPYAQFEIWLQEAIASEVEEPNAMILATATKEGYPSSRTVLLKRFDQNGLEFFTNSESRKAKELAENPRASVTFLWKEIERQVTIEGTVEKTSEKETALYFSKRPKESQLGAWSSRQDTVLESREELEISYQKFADQFKEQVVTAPPYWCGFRIIPTRLEFWQGRPNRLHDRFVYVWNSEKWQINRLSP